MKLNKLTYKPFGEKALLIEWPTQMNEHILQEIVGLQQKIKATNLKHIYDSILGFHSLMLLFKNPISNFDQCIDQIKKIHQDEFSLPKEEQYIWEIPVCYDTKFGIDLEEMATAKGISSQEIIQLHVSTLYPVYFIGFLPGFLYLGGLDKKLYMPRRSSPRLVVNKGAVGIGGMQTGIYPMASSGGWNIIGNTPIELFDVDADSPCFAKSGDAIQFFSISFDEYQEIQQMVAKGECGITKRKRNA